MNYTVTGTPERGLTGATLGFFFGFAAVALFGPTAKLLQDVMGLSPAQLGLLVAIPSLTGSLLRIPFSAWVDKVGGRLPFLVLMVLAFIGMSGLSLLFLFNYPDGLTQAHFPIIIILGMFSGCGIATFAVGTSQVSYWFPQKRQGWALGIFGGLGNVAPGIFSFLLPLALAVMPLPSTYVVWTIILLIGLIIYYFFGKNAPYFQILSQGATKEEAKIAAKSLYTDPCRKQELFPSGGVIYTIKKSAGNIHTWILMLLYFVSFGGFMALTSWFFLFWQSLFGYSVTTAGLLTGIYAILASLIRVPGGSIADRIGGMKASAISVAILGIGAVIVVFSQGIGATFSGVVLMAIGMGINNASVFKMVPIYIPEAIGGAVGWVGGLGAFGGFVLPPVLALFVQSSGIEGYRQGFIVYVGLAILCMFLLVFLKNRQNKH